MQRWTEESKKEALKLMGQGKNDKEISAIVKMSTSSVSLFRYKTFNVNSERIKCAICGKEMKQINNKHLKSHEITLEKYKALYPNHPVCTEKRKQSYKSFKSPNKGKTYDEIYGKEEGDKKRAKITKKQLGRPAPKKAGTGITGTRRDTGTYARSTYEANIDRIFHYEKVEYVGELNSENERFFFPDGSSYQPDRIDKGGLFEKGAYLEIKGYMFPDDWKKICLFREHYSNKKLLVICPDEKCCDINYKDLTKKYKDLIPLWEGENNNYKTRPDLYKISYVAPERVNFLKENYPNAISVSIDDNHKKFISKKVVEFNKSKGKKVYVDSLSLLKITDRRPKSRVSTGSYHYELWEVITESGEIFYVTNQEKTVAFRCLTIDKKDKAFSFFEDNCDMSLSFGKKS